MDSVISLPAGDWLHLAKNMYIKGVNKLTEQLAQDTSSVEDNLMLFHS
ncbi:hypothetical protein [Pedobacter aquatilis]|nr:hypothetical protein [Pedobacter aquatilis]